MTVTVPNAQTKIEGVPVRDPMTIAVSNDNDMRDGLDAFDPSGHQNDTGIPSRLLVLRLSAH